MPRTKKTAAPTDDRFIEFLLGLRDVIDNFLEEGARTAKPADVEDDEVPAKPKKALAVVPDVDDDDESEEEEDAEPKPPTEAELQKMSVAKLRSLALDAGFLPEDVKSAGKDDLIEALTSDDEGEDDQEEEPEDRETLEDLSLAELKAKAKEKGFKLGEIRGKKANDLIDLILGTDEETQDEDDDQDDDGDDEGVTEDELQALDIDELKKMAQEYGLKVRANARKSSLIANILEAADEAEDDE